MSAEIPAWGQLAVSLLLLLSAVATLAASWGIVRLRIFFQRMHPPALVYTWAAWCVTLASILYFSLQTGRVQLRAWLVIILLSITVPITTVLLSRAALFRARRKQSDQVPPPLHPHGLIGVPAPGFEAAPDAPHEHATSRPAGRGGDAPA